MSSALLLALALVLAACGPGGNELAFLNATADLGGTDDQRLSAGWVTCNEMDEVVEFGDVAACGADTAYVYARDAGASQEQAANLVRSAARYLCPTYLDDVWDADSPLLDDLESCLATSPPPLPPYCPVVYE